MSYSIADRRSLSLILLLTSLPLMMTLPNSAWAKSNRHIPLLYPLKSPPSVSSSFGTYRINHHHSGVDLYAFEGTPVIAAADGVVSIIKRGSGGYGRAIYLSHKGGFTTLYAHLSAFAPRIERLVMAKQKKRGDFKMKIRPREKIRFKAGDVIGWSGTSGTDLCHLHFELRHKNAPINPLVHGLTLPDHSPPTLITLFADPLDEKARVEGTLIPQRYPLADRPPSTIPLATALTSTQQSVDTASIETRSPSTVIPTSPTPTPLLPTITIWGNVGLSVEVEDRIDGSQRALTPHEIILYVDDRVIHHLRYDETSYADKRSSELDFDLSRRGDSKKLIHRLYRYGPRLRALKHGSTRPFKRLKEGQHKARIVAIDAAGNQSSKAFMLNVRKPSQSTCHLKRKRLPRSKPSLLWQPHMPDAPQVHWRPYGLSFTLPKPCDTEVPLEIDLRVGQKRAPKKALSLSTLGNKTFINLHFDRLKFDPAKEKTQKTKKTKKSKTTKKTQIKNRELIDQDLPPDRSLELTIGLRGLLHQPISQKENVTAMITDDGDPSSNNSNNRGLKTLYRYKIKIHEVRENTYFNADGVRVFVGEDSPFKPYITSLATLPKPPQKKASTMNESTVVPAVKNYSKRYLFAQPWLPMKKANEILIEKSKRRGKHLGAYLINGDRQWWVTSSWGQTEVGASSTHLAEFIITQDNSDPIIGKPRWDLVPPMGPRLIIPVSDEISGLSRLKLEWKGKEVPIEIQRSWKRLIYTPQTPLENGQYPYQISLRDRGGRRTHKDGQLTWPPAITEVISPTDPLRKLLEPPNYK